MTDPAVFLREFARDRAEQVVPTPGGFAALSPRGFPHAYDHNGLWVSEPVDPDALIGATEDLLAPFGHRRIDVASGPLTDDLAARLTGAGYERGDLVLMTQRRAPDADRPPTGDLALLTTAGRVEFSAAVWAETAPDMPAAERRELAERAHTAVSAARCSFLGVVGEDGATQASCDLFVRGDTAQIEEVGTLLTFRNRGYASRLVRGAAERATSDPGVTTVFLVAEADDWPRQLYTRLGFDVTDTATRWTRVLSRL